MTYSTLVKSSKSGEYITPIPFFVKLNSIFQFDLDAATNENNPLKTKHFFTEKDNALEKEWDGNTYCNPPFGKGIKKWIHKMDYEAGQHPHNNYIMLLPMSLETNWFQDNIWFNKRTSRVDHIYLIRGRLAFMAMDPEFSTGGNSHIKGSMLWICNAVKKELDELQKQIPGILITNDETRGI